MIIANYNTDENNEYVENEYLYTLNNWPIRKDLRSASIILEQFKERHVLVLEIITQEYINEPLIILSEEGLIEPLVTKARETYFGFTNSIQECETNDIILPGLKEDQICRYNRQFYIRYDDVFNKFMIKDLANGFGSFIKLKNKHKINNNFLFNIGDTYIVAKLEKPSEAEEEYLVLRIFTGVIKYDPVKFFRTKKSISIGRSIDCDVSINDSLLSRLHCMIQYNSSYWYLQDGYQEGEKSTNGTWIYTSDEVDLENNDIIKTNSILLKVRTEY